MTFTRILFLICIGSTSASVFNIAPGMVFIDFGFLEPAMLTALPRVAKEGGKLPESVNGKLAVRVAMSYDDGASC
jgi:hypothetical protein